MSRTTDIFVQEGTKNNKQLSKFSSQWFVDHALPVSGNLEHIKLKMERRLALGVWPYKFVSPQFVLSPRLRFPSTSPSNSVRTVTLFTVRECRFCPLFCSKTRHHGSLHPLCLCTRCGSPSSSRCQREARFTRDRQVYTCEFPMERQFAAMALPVF